MQYPKLQSKVKIHVDIYFVILENLQVFDYTNLKGCSFYLPDARVLANLSYSASAVQMPVQLPSNIFSFLKQSPDLESFHLKTNGQYPDGGFDAFNQGSFRFPRLRTLKFGTTLDGLRSSQLDMVRNTPRHLRPRWFSTWTDVEFSRQIQSSVLAHSSLSPIPATPTITSLQACDNSCLDLPTVEKAMIEELSFPPNPWMDSNLWVHSLVEKRLENFTNVATLSIEILYVCVRPHPWLVSIGRMPRLERLRLTYETARYNEPWVRAFFSYNCFADLRCRRTY
jgi:hypothetical protein